MRHLSQSTPLVVCNMMVIEPKHQLTQNGKANGTDTGCLVACFGTRKRVEAVKDAGADEEAELEAYLSRDLV